MARIGLWWPALEVWHRQGLPPEIEVFIPYAADLFLRGCGYRPKI